MPIKQWPEHERPREKLLHRGAASLSDAEILAIFFRTGIKGMTALDLARNMLEEKGGLKALLEETPDHFIERKGMGPAKYVQLQAAIELGKRYLASQLEQQDVISSPEMTRTYLQSRLHAYQHEVFACLFLDTRHHVIRFDEMFTGTIDSASVYPREVVKRALFLNAAAVIFTHNHPSGIAEPSQADRSLTERLKNALLMVDIRVLDHIIVGSGQTVSFAERGWI